MRISKSAVLNATNNTLIVGHNNWQEALVVESQTDGSIIHPGLEDGCWVFPIDNDVKEQIGLGGNELYLESGVLGWWVPHVLKGSSDNSLGDSDGDPLVKVETRDCPGITLTAY